MGSLKKSIAITGAGGDIATRLLARLHEAGTPCRGLLRRISPRLARLSEIDVRRVDLTDPAATAAALVGCNVVVHTALDQSSAENPAAMVSNNIRLLDPLVTACRRAGVRRFIHLSSIVVLPPRITPDAVRDANIYSREEDWYSKTKIASEKWLRAKASDLELCFVRAGLVYGPYMNWTNYALTKLREGILLLPVGIDAPCYAIHVDDLCDQLAVAADYPKLLPKLLYGINPEPLTWEVFYTKLGSGAGLSAPLTARYPLEELIESSPARSWISTAKKTGKWLWMFPLIPQRLRSASPVLSIIRILKNRMAVDRSSMPQTLHPASTRPVSQPSRFELETFLSTAKFTPEQTGSEIGFTCRRPFTVGLRDTLAWWQADISDLLDFES